jgi:hypothetical protein
MQPKAFTGGTFLLKLRATFRAQSTCRARGDLIFESSWSDVKNPISILNPGRNQTDCRPCNKPVKSSHHPQWFTSVFRTTYLLTFFLEAYKLKILPISWTWGCFKMMRRSYQTRRHSVRRSYQARRHSVRPSYQTRRHSVLIGLLLALAAVRTFHLTYKCLLLSS